MIDNTEKIIALLDEMSSVIDIRVDLYMIGGGAMLFMGLKEFTKDIDLVVSTEREYDTITAVLSSMGFRTDRPSLGMDRVNLSDTRVRGEYRIDLFGGVICGHLQLSESMKGRSTKQYESEWLNLYTCSKEDIFLLKSVTEREGDVTDCNRLIRATEQFDWSYFIDELNEQMSFGNPVWITYVLERLIGMDIGSYRPDVYDAVSQMEKDFMTKWADDFERNKE